jgi:hypothetical protein
MLVVTIVVLSSCLLLSVIPTVVYTDTSVIFVVCSVFYVLPSGCML